MVQARAIAHLPSSIRRIELVDYSHRATWSAFRPVLTSVPMATHLTALGLRSDYASVNVLTACNQAWQKIELHSCAFSIRDLDHLLFGARQSLQSLTLDLTRMGDCINLLNGLVNMAPNLTHLSLFGMMYVRIIADMSSDLALAINRFDRVQHLVLGGTLASDVLVQALTTQPLALRLLSLQLRQAWPKSMPIYASSDPGVGQDLLAPCETLAMVKRRRFPSLVKLVVVCMSSAKWNHAVRTEIVSEGARGGLAVDIS